MTCLRPRSSAEPSSSSSVAALREEPSRTVRSSSLTRHRNPVFIEHVCIEHRPQHKAGLLFLFSAEEARTRVGVGGGVGVRMGVHTAEVATLGCPLYSPGPRFTLVPSLWPQGPLRLPQCRVQLEPPAPLPRTLGLDLSSPKPSPAALPGAGPASSAPCSPRSLPAPLDFLSIL